ncbi:MAG: lysyl oxidase family protein [Candidatus Sericytochromatia bacterium]|nr:lysyl oxidase family protein [Candidatus Sericytochromatia bacterium]
MRWMRRVSGGLTLALATAACTSPPGSEAPQPLAGEALPDKAFFVDKENDVDGELYPGAYNPDAPPYRLSAVGLLPLTGAAADRSLYAPARAIDGNSSTQWAHGTYRATDAWWSARLSAPTSLSTLRVKSGPLRGAASYDIELRVGGAWVAVATGVRNTTWSLETKTFAAREADAVRLVFRNDAARTHPRFTLFEVQALGEAGEPATAPSPSPSLGISPSVTPPPSTTVDARRYAPDLRAVAPRRPILVTQNGRRLLRFDNLIPNVGQGPFQVRAYNQDGVTRAYQEILDPGGRVVATKYVGAFEFHPSHNHFHLGDVALYQLRANSPTGSLMRQGYKVSFCLMDSQRYLSTAPASRYGGCNQIMQGIQRGWGDMYDRWLPGQEFDVTGYPAGNYYIVSLTDPTNKFVDPERGNEVSWLQLYLNPAIPIMRIVSASSP